MKKMAIFSLVGALLVLPLLAQEEVKSSSPEVKTSEVVSKKSSSNTKEIEGVVNKIAEDKSYIVVGNTKILTTPAFLEESYIEVGDNIKAICTQTDKGLEATDFEYIFEEGSDKEKKKQ